MRGGLTGKNVCFGSDDIGWLNGSRGSKPNLPIYNKPYYHPILKEFYYLSHSWNISASPIWDTYAPDLPLNDLGHSYVNLTST